MVHDPHPNPRPPTLGSARARPLALLVAITLAFGAALLAPTASAQAGWDLRVCADPKALPASNDRLEGFDNRIAAVLADELDATLSYVWTKIDPYGIRTELRAGACDLVFGVAEGTADLLNTVPYYRAPFVLVTRADAPFDPFALDAPEAADHRYAVVANTLPHLALVELGLARQAVAGPLDNGADGPERSRPVLRTLLDGEADVALLYGPDAALLADSSPVPLRITPLEPQIVPPVLQMFRIATIGVRAGDDAFRDRLNRALAARWDDVQAILAESGVPLLDVARPIASPPSDEAVLRIGAVLPTPTATPRPTDTMGAAASVGAQLAEDLAGRDLGADAPRLDVLFASGPSPEATERAARRLLATEDVRALVGGIGDGQAAVLTAVAAHGHVPFLDIGATTEQERGGRCDPWTFHVEASAAMYLDALAQGYAALGHEHWFVVTEGTAEGRRLLTRARQAIGGVGGAVAGVAEVAPGFATDRRVFDRIRASGADAVLLLNRPAAQEFWLSQFGLEGIDAALAGYPYPEMQTRDFLVRLQQAGNLGPRVALWDPGLRTYGAAELAQRFAGRSGHPMDPSGWAGYAAVSAVYQAALSAGTSDPAALAAALAAPGTSFDLGKGPATGFRAWDHQLRQPLYLVTVDPDAPWGREVATRTALAGVSAVLPTDTADPAALDTLGDGPGVGGCGAAP